MTGICAVVCGYGVIIGVKCRMVHPQRWGKGSREGCFDSSGSRYAGHIGSPLRELAGARVVGAEAGMTGKLSATLRVAAGAGVAGMEGSTTWEAVLYGVLSPTLRDEAGDCWLVGVGGVMQDEHKRLEGL